jgi:uncharacterized protein (DUF2384 family)
MASLEDIARELREIDALATQVFGSHEEEKTKWFNNNKIFSLNGKVPNDLLATQSGREIVRNLLGGIYHGFLA